MRLSRHNYTQYSNKKYNENSDEVKMELESAETAEIAVTDVIEEVVEEKKTAQSVKGIVANCTKLNVRSKPIADADIVCVLPAKSEVKIDLDASTDDWFAVWTTAGVKGYCMQKYIDARL